MRILFLQKRPLYPPMTGGQIRTLNVVRHLARWHDITYLCNVQKHERNDLPKMEALGLELETISWREAPRRSPRFYFDLLQNLASPYPFNVDKDYDPQLRARTRELLAGKPFDLVICDFVQMARNLIGLPASASLLFQHNVEAQIFERHSRQDEGWLRRKYMTIQWRKMRKFEASAGRQFDGVVAVSEEDRRKFEREYGWNHVRVIDTAVDTEYFAPRTAPDAEVRVVFVGSLDWLPNEDGVRYFVEQVWPAIRAERPNARFQAVGRSPSAALRRLASAPGVEIVGTVPDVRPYIAAATVVVVPLRVGGGTRMKIYEAMAMRRAVVSTTLGAEGLRVNDGGEIVLADTVESFARQVTSLLEDSSLRRRIADRAYECVTQKYSAEVVARQFESICQDTVVAAEENDNRRRRVRGDCEFCGNTRQRANCR
jgi:glycosyltransferase involved in cell wall biosynthesis